MKKNHSEIKIDSEKSISLDSLMELVENPSKMLWINFKAGFVRGFAGIIGAAVAFIVIGFLVAKLGGLPIIGDFLKQIGEAIKSAN